MKKKSVSEVINILRSNASKFCKAAQNIYDHWEQDSEGFSEEYGYGGICDAIAYKFHDIITSLGFDAFTNHNENFSHTSAYAYYCSGDEETQWMICVDISPYDYEDGAAYTWKKLPNIEFHPTMLNITDHTGYLDQYFDKDCEYIT